MKIMQFWYIAYMYNWITIDQLRLTVKTIKNPFGEITVNQFKQITGKDF